MGFFYMMSMCVSTLDVTEREMQVLLTRIMDIRHCTKFLDSCFFLLQTILSFPILTVWKSPLHSKWSHIPPSSCSSLSPPVSLYNGLFLVFSNTGLSWVSRNNYSTQYFFNHIGLWCKHCAPVICRTASNISASTVVLYCFCFSLNKFCHVKK